MTARILFLTLSVFFFVACQPESTQTEHTTVEEPKNGKPPVDGSSVGGVDVGNGGDAVRCASGKGNDFSGLYSLDYLLTEGPDAPKTVAVNSWNESRQRLFQLLKKIHPQLAWSFYEFTSQMANHSNYELDRVWESSDNALVDIKDEKLLKKLPPNCIGQSSTQFLQAVIRQAKPTLTTYLYAQDVITELQSKNPLQYSFLMVHEWLWDYTGDVAAIRQFNRLLHSEQLETMTSGGLESVFGNLGLKLPPLLVERGAYHPQDALKVNSSGDFGACYLAPMSNADPHKIIIGRLDSPHSCWNYDGVISLRYVCTFALEEVGGETKPRAKCTVDKGLFEFTDPDFSYDVDSIEIISRRHFVATLLPGPVRAQSAQVDYYYSDFQVPK